MKDEVKKIGGLKPTKDVGCYKNTWRGWADELNETGVTSPSDWLFLLLLLNEIGGSSCESR